MNLTDTERAELRDALAKAEHLAREHARILEGCRAIIAEPPVDVLADPLAAFRLPSGAVGYVTTYADRVKVGDWVQRCHGDPDWHLVERVAVTTDPLTLTRMVNVWADGSSYWWNATDAIRRATPPDVVVAGQERKAEATR